MKRRSNCLIFFGQKTETYEVCNLPHPSFHFRVSQGVRVNRTPQMARPEGSSQPDNATTNQIHFFAMYVYAHKLYYHGYYYHS